MIQESSLKIAFGTTNRRLKDMARSNRKGKLVALCGFLLVFSVGIAVAWQNGWGFRPASTIYESKINEDSRQQPFAYRVSDLNTDESLDFVQFINANVGWACSHNGTLYRTNDAGKRWERIESKLAGYLSSMHFSSALSGWVILQQYKQDMDKAEDQAAVLHTDDGGSSWQVQFSAKSLWLIQMSFASPSEGWVIGRSFFKQRDALRSEFLLLHTTDAGSNWTDVSKGLNRSMADLWGRVWESPTDIITTKPGALTVLTENASIITTVDGGVRWQSSGAPATEGLGAWMLVPSASHFPRVLAGKGGNHGTVSLLALRQNDGSWTSRVVDRVFLRDALYVSEGELLACGSMLSANNQPLELSGEGVVLHSPDDGLNWTIVYRSPKVRSLNALGRSDAEHIWAVGSNGSIVGLERR